MGILSQELLLCAYSNSCGLLPRGFSGEAGWYTFCDGYLFWPLQLRPLTLDPALNLTFGFRFVFKLSASPLVFGGCWGMRAKSDRDDGVVASETADVRES